MIHVSALHDGINIQRQSCAVDLFGWCLSSISTSRGEFKLRIRTKSRRATKGAVGPCVRKAHDEPEMLSAFQLYSPASTSMHSNSLF